MLWKPCSGAPSGGRQRRQGRRQGRRCLLRHPLPAHQLYSPWTRAGTRLVSRARERGRKLNPPRDCQTSSAGRLPACSQSACCCSADGHSPCLCDQPADATAAMPLAARITLGVRINRACVCKVAWQGWQGGTRAKHAVVTRVGQGWNTPPLPAAMALGRRPQRLPPAVGARLATPPGQLRL